MKDLTKRFCEFIHIFYTGRKKHFITRTASGFLKLLPIAVLGWAISKLYGLANGVAGSLFELVNLSPSNYQVLWTILGLTILVITCFLFDCISLTKIGGYCFHKLDGMLQKLPLYPTLKKIAGIIFSSKSGERKVLIVMIPGFSKKGYNFGIMYSTDEGIVKNHYTVTVPTSPFPNGGYLFEESCEDIRVTDVTFEEYFSYLLSMATKSVAEGKRAKVKTFKAKSYEEYPTLKQYFEIQKEKKSNITAKTPVKTEKKKGRPKL